MPRLLVAIYFVFISVWSAQAQIVIFGALQDAANGEPVAYAQVVLYRYKTNEVVTFTMANEKGQYALTIERQGSVFTLKTNSLTHENVEKDIFIDATGQQRYEVNIPLAAKAHTLAEAQVTSKLPPMIVKQDTIVYNTDHWADEFDQSLEAVLAKIPGFEVLENGELKVNGKLVNKVLINGEELTDGGAALLTRNLTPDRVQSVEVRFKEKDDKIRESLLSQNDFVVLDIKLKDDFDHSLFGRLEATLGHQTRLRPGGVARMFSLRDKVKFQLLGEWDEFGDKTIELSNIQNLGAEAYAQIFEVPADFNRLRANPEFNNEVYGFREYNSNRAGSIGLTGKVDLSPSVELFFGSYNYLDRVGMQRDFSQVFITDPPIEFSFQEAQSLYGAYSKNKAEIVVNKKDTKLKYNFNAVLGRNEADQRQREFAGLQYDFLDASNSREFYHNLFAERRFSESSGIQLNALYNFTDQETDRTLWHNNPLYARFFENLSGSWPQQIRQRIPVTQERWLANLFYQTEWKGQFIKTGFRYLQHTLSGQRQFFQGEQPWNNGARQSDPQTLSHSQALPFVEHSVGFGAFSWENKAGVAFNFFPVFGQTERQQQAIFEWNTRLNVTFNDGDDVSFSYTQNTSSFPLYQLLFGQELLDFQTFAVPGRYDLLPRRERVLSFSAQTFALSDYGLAFEFAGISGKAFNSPAFEFNEFGLITQYYDQLPSYYLVLINKIGKVFTNLPLQMKLEAGYIMNRNYNRLPGTDEQIGVANRIRLLDYRAFTTLKEKTFDFETRIKFTDFTFLNDLEATAPRSQRMWNALLKYKQALWQRRFLFTASGRYTAFTGLASSNLLLADASLSYVRKKHAISLQVHNVFNGQTFVLQNITPAFYTESQQFIFGRYIKLGFSFDVN